MDSIPPPHPAEALLDKYFDQGLTPAEQAQLDAWLCADPRNAEAFARWILAHAQTPQALARAAQVGAEGDEFATGDMDEDEFPVPDASVTAGSLAVAKMRRRKQTSGLKTFGQFLLIAALLALVVGGGVWFALKPADQSVAKGAKPAPVAVAPRSVAESDPAPKPAEDLVRPAPVAVRTRKSASAPEVQPTVPTAPSPPVATADPEAVTDASPPVAEAVVPETSAEKADGVEPDAAADPASMTLASSAAVELPPEAALDIPHLDRMVSSIRGCRNQLADGRFSEALKRLEPMKDKHLTAEEHKAVLGLIDYAYDHGLTPQVEAIEKADPLQALRLFNLLSPPGAKTPVYAPRLQARIAALEARLRSPEGRALQNIGRDFEALYGKYQAFPEEYQPKLAAFAEAHAKDPYGPMAVRVLAGKTPVEMAVASGASGLRDVASGDAVIAYPTDMGAFKCDVPQNGAEFKKVCLAFLDQSEAALKQDCADFPQCTPAFWAWLGRHSEIRTGLLLARNPVPARFAANLATFYQKFGERACGRYGQLVLASALTEQDVAVQYGTKAYAESDFSDNQKKVGDYLYRHNVPFWIFVKEPALYARKAGGSPDDLGDIEKMAYLSHTYPPRIGRSRLEYLRSVIGQQETHLGSVTWPIFPVVQTPYILLNPVASANNLSQREHAFVWERYCGGGGVIGYGNYGWEYELPEVKYKKSFWHPNSVVRMIEDGGVCGRMAGMQVIGKVLLGVPCATAGQPGHCAYLQVDYDGKAYGVSIGDSVTGTWMNTSGHEAVGISPAIDRLGGEAVGWLAMAKTVNRVGMVNYHASLVAGYMADTTRDPEAQKRWLDLAIRVNPFHLTAIEKRWGIASDQGANELNRVMQATIMRMAVKPGRDFDSTEIGADETNIIRKLVGRNLAPMYDKIMVRDGNGEPPPYRMEVGVEDDAPAKAGTPGGEQFKGSSADEVNDEAKRTVALAVSPDKTEVKEDLNLMNRYMMAFAKKGLLYGYTKEVFLKHLSRVDPAVALKMLNNMLAEALKLPPDQETNDEADSPLLVVTKAIGEMSMQLSAEDRSRGLHALCAKIAQGSPRFYKKRDPELVNKKTVFTPSVRPNKAYMLAFNYLEKDLRQSGPKGVELATKAKLNMGRELAVLTYECQKERYSSVLGQTGSPPPDGVPKPPDLSQYVYHPPE